MGGILGSCLHYLSCYSFVDRRGRTAVFRLTNGAIREYCRKIDIVSFNSIAMS